MEEMEHERLGKVQTMMAKYSELVETIIRPTEQVGGGREGGREGEGRREGEREGGWRKEGGRMEKGGREKLKSTHSQSNSLSLHCRLFVCLGGREREYVITLAYSPSLRPARN